MKHTILYEIMRKLKSKPALKRKLKVIAAIGVTCLLVLGGLAIWAGVSAVKYPTTLESETLLANLQLHSRIDLFI